MIVRLLVLLTLLLPGSLSASQPVEREELTDAQLLEVLARDGDRDGDPSAGVATYYAARFVGRRTSSGQRYDPDRLTAAHADLPLGSLVTVENRANGKRVTVLVNDRCRKRSFQLIDLSRSAARQIDLWGKGAVKVRILPYAQQDPLRELLATVKE